LVSRLAPPSGEKTGQRDSGGIYLTTAKNGLAVLTENTDDFDLIRQIASRGSFIHF
jgi:hypothetical protein